MHDMSRHKGTAKFTIMDKQVSFIFCLSFTCAHVLGYFSLVYFIILQIPLSVQNSIIGRAVVVHGDPDDLGRGKLLKHCLEFFYSSFIFFITIHD